MPLPELTAGLVVRYEYLWHRLSAAGAAGAHKDHPACVAATFRRQDRPEDFVIYFPITHAEPAGEDEGMELPDDVKRKAGLDGGRQWILVSEYNLDTWPADLRQIPNRPGVFHYGHLPPSMFRKVVQAFWERYRQKRLRPVDRTPP